MLDNLTYKKKRKVSSELIKKHSLVQNLRPLLEGLCKSRNTKKNKIQAILIEGELRDLKKETKQMSEDEIKMKNQMK